MLGANPANAATSLLYTGEMYDSSASMYYLRARWYDAATGRFNRMDPFAGNNQDPQSLHKYLYCHANPVNGIDPTGLEFSYTSILSALKTIAVFIGKILLPTFLRHNMLTVFVVRFLIGAGIGATIMHYAEHYIPPLVTALRGLAVSLAALGTIRGLLLAAAAFGMSYLLRNMHRDIISKQILRPIFYQQLGAFINIVRLYRTISPFLDALRWVEKVIPEVINSIPGLHFQIISDVRVSAFAWAVALKKVDPAGDINLLSQIVDHHRLGQVWMKRFKALILAARLRQYDFWEIRLTVT